MKCIKEIIDEHEWLIIGIAAAVTAVLGIYGFYEFNENTNTGGRTISDSIYLTWQLFTLESGAPQGVLPWQLEAARWLAPFIIVYAAIKGIVALAQERISMLGLKKFKNHMVICGLGQKGLCFARDFIAENKNVVIIEINDKNNELAAFREEKNVKVLIGDATDKVLLAKARIASAHSVYALTGSDQTNIEIAIKANQLMESMEKTSGRTDALTCYIHIFNRDLRQLFYDHGIFTQTKHFNAELFNLYEKSARLLFDEYSPDQYIPAPQPGSPPVHIMIIGFGWMGESLVTQAIRAGHFANEKNLIITILDKDAQKRKTQYLNHYDRVQEYDVPSSDKLHNINQIADLRFHPCDIDILERTDFEKMQENLPVCAACYICLGKDEIWNLAVAIRIRNLFNQNAPPIIVAMPQMTGISSLIVDDLKTKQNIHLFNVIAQTCIEDEIKNDAVEKIAEQIHLFYIKHREDEGQTPETNSSIKPWDQCTESEKDTNRHAADHIGIKLRAAGYRVKELKTDHRIVSFTEDHIKILERIEHRRWCAERLLLGWVYGENKDMQKKYHNCLRLYDNLPANEKDKDREAIKDIPEVLKAAGKCMALTDNCADS